MTAKARWFFVVSMDVAPEHEALFNEVYDTEHVPYLTVVPGVLSATRTVREPLDLLLGGSTHRVDPGDEPKYSVTYEIAGPEVLTSAAWGEAGERGRWATEVRPLTHNRRHVLRRQIG